MSDSKPRTKPRISTPIFGIGPAGTHLTGEDHTFIFHNLWKVFVDPKFTAQSLMSAYPKITYRKLNHWEETGLISPFRKTENTGWRKLSFMNIVQLVLIDQLKEIGLSTKRIKTAIESVSERKYKLFHDGDIKMSELEHTILTSLTSSPTGILIYESGKTISGLLELHIIDSILETAGRESHVYVSMKTAVDIALVSSNRIPEATTAYTPMIEAKLIKLLRIIRNHEYETIQLSMKDGAVQKIKSTKRTRGKATQDQILNAIKSGSLKQIIVSKGRNEKELVLTEEEIISL